ncbi:hypothetical protein R0J91_00015 [Micrococcus sp. SIMBA_131]|uniref:hypothetical protein n=1 Tax=Micrococcus luteus TaxID=1270 RepID=UPI003017EFC5|nr:hypothetical protein [Micrococcus luteus]
MISLTGLTPIHLGHEPAEDNLGMVAARDGAVSSPLSRLGLEENAAAVTGLRVTGDSHDEDKNARDEIGRLRYD